MDSREFSTIKFFIREGFRNVGGIKFGRFKLLLNRKNQFVLAIVGKLETVNCTGCGKELAFDWPYTVCYKCLDRSDMSGSQKESLRGKDLKVK
jgi:hypothetical protein